MEFRRRHTVPTTIATDPRERAISRRGVLKTGIGATAALLVPAASARGQGATPSASPVAGLTEEQRGWLERASRNDVNGWVHLKIEGAPFERGFQHGYLVAAEYADALRVYEAMTYQTMGLDYSFFVDKAVEFHKSKITPELTEEMEGIAAGLTAAGVPTTLDDIIGWNAYMEMTGYWWPTVASQYVNDAPNGNRKSHCWAFIATGSATTDGRIVIGHESFTEFWNGQYMNVILDITPTDGYRMVMQTSPGWIASMTDFWVTGGGMVVVETTMVGYEGYDTSKVPEYVRARNACQYATSIDEWVKLMDAQDNGGYANMWLIGDIKTNEIAKYEQGLIYQDLRKKTRRLVLRRQRPARPAHPQRGEHRHGVQRRAPADRRAPHALAAAARPVRGPHRRRDRADDAGRHLRSLPRATSSPRRARSAPTTTPTRCTTSAIRTRSGTCRSIRPDRSTGR